ncbi:uncharacterized protein LOC128546987 [Mercenaria mercenaria]|uniref:uncharacterized protein LOC128546987 n=1 Tax=Mercenaria mercenaria TaxID=6596 RepID=UPI00234F7C4F|nr:uncharacterized protein LOC128546987 [Mercenaria mercenaria]
MEFKEVENINKEVIIKVQNKIHVNELVPYMAKWGCSTMTIQGIEREIINNGEACAVSKFLDAVRRRPQSFPKMMATLKDTKQDDIYKIFMKQIRKYFEKKEIRLAEVLSLIQKEERELGITDDPDDVGIDHASSTGNIASSRDALAGQPSSNTPSDNQWSQDRKDGQSPERSPQNRPDLKDNQLVRSKTQMPSTLSSSSSNYDSLPGATGNLGRDLQNPVQSSVPPAQLDPNFGGACISSLKTKVFNSLGKELQKENIHDEDDGPWWNYILNNEELDVSRDEQIEIEKYKRPGVKFLDMLGQRKYTLQDLERLFIQFGITEALNILRQHQNKVICDRNSNQASENNLNINQREKADANKDMNISVPQTDAPEDIGEKNLSSSPPVQRPANTGEFHRSSSNVSRGTLNSDTSSLSLESCTENFESSLQTFRSIEDEQMKGTTAVQAHGDPTGIRSQPNPEDDARKLRNDRVNQFDNEPGAIENTSYIDVNNGEKPVSCNLPRSQTVDVNVENLPCNQEGQMRNSEQPGRTGSVVNLPSENGGQNWSSGTSGIPLLSGFQSVAPNASTEEPGGGENNESQGVGAVPPRSNITGDVMLSADLQPRIGVHCVPPSIESQHSREVTEDISNIQSGASGNDESLGSLRDPDLIHGTQAAENVASDLTEENSEK